ncbi:PPOX class F420-dependent oxidoreductase [Streptomyces sp. NPDC053499]|uniref:PPOX class F420-dependent oxidoreductase n=1 Tax=Streptomyces sp. NPDC053499 TaxID=3365707 RepID=UPI0037D5924A
MTQVTQNSGAAPAGSGGWEFSAAEREFLASQRLGRLATVDTAGQPQNNPVGFFPQDDGTILVGGYALGTTKKWRNLRTQPRLSLVVDDIVSLKPWRVRGVEIRGVAELREGPHDLGPHFSDELIVIHPRKVHSWGLAEE